MSGTTATAETSGKNLDATSEETTLDANEQVIDENVTQETEDASGEEFSSAALEKQFGFPDGSLKDYKDEKSALEAIQHFTDEALQAGLDLATTTAPPTSQPDAETDETAETDATAGSSATKPTDAALTSQKELEQRIARLENSAQQRDQAQFEASKRAVEQRLVSHIDKWKSPKFGVSGNRTYKQKKAVMAFRNTLLNEYVPGLYETKQGIPVVETAADRLLAYDDPDEYVRQRNSKKGANKRDTLGTPGGSSSAGAGGNSPSNIHEAAFVGGRFVKPKR